VKCERCRSKFAGLTALFGAVSAIPCAAYAAELSSARLAAAPLAAPAETFAVHGQATFVEQATSDFNAHYSGTNSLSPRIARETFDATLYLGARLWAGAQALLRQLHASVDYQFIRNPAYNSDRGPVSVFAVRVHAQM